MPSTYAIMIFKTKSPFPLKKIIKMPFGLASNKQISLFSSLLKEKLSSSIWMTSNIDEEKTGILRPRRKRVKKIKLAKPLVTLEISSKR